MTVNHDVVFVYVTAPSSDVAEKITTIAVDEKLAACGNILPGMTSIYKWQGKTEQAQEIVLILKTRAALFEKLSARIAALHPYDVPCIVALPVSAGLPSYLSWINAETAA